MTLLDRDGLKAKGIRYSNAHLWRLVKGGKFPAPIKIGEARSAWIEAEIDAWIGMKIAERDASLGNASKGGAIWREVGHIVEPCATVINPSQPKVDAVPKSKGGMNSI
jgi:prophage regulatory protein